MDKKEMRKAIEEGLTLYFASGKVITKCPEATMAVKKRSRKKKEEPTEVQTEHLPQALKIRFGYQKD